MMKNKKILKWLIIYVILLISVILMPLLAVKEYGCKMYCKGYEKVKPAAEKADQKCFRVFDEATKKIIDVPDREFVYGVVTAEMPAKFEDEAIKAQAVASYTYFCRERKAKRSKRENADYDFTVDTKKWLNYVPPEERKLKWGEHFDEYENKIEGAVDSVFGEVLEDGGELILAAYHAISSGKTERSADVFGGDVRYLKSVESPGDKFASGYETTLKVDADKFRSVLKSKFSDLKFEGAEESWIGESSRSEGGMIKEIKICGEPLKGTEMRSMFGLRSSDFDLKFNRDEKKFVFTVKGYGHGVGMSQHGAQYMAREGDDYKKILSWYYPGTCICKLDS